MDECAHLPHTISNALNNINQRLYTYERLYTHDPGTNTVGAEAGRILKNMRKQSILVSNKEFSGSLYYSVILAVRMS